MGTRALIHLCDGPDNGIATLCSQFDGYPSGLGYRIADFLAKGHLVNGIQVGSDLEKRHEAGTANLFNGMHSLAALLIAEFKGRDSGGFYLYPHGTSNIGEEFVYSIYRFGAYPGFGEEGVIHMTCKSTYSGDTETYDGPASGFRDWYNGIQESFDD